MRSELRADVFIWPVPKKNQTHQMSQLQQHQGCPADYPLRGKDFEEKLTIEQKNGELTVRAAGKPAAVPFIKWRPRPQLYVAAR
jgi:hypothetical protein